MNAIERQTREARDVGDDVDFRRVENTIIASPNENISLRDIRQIYTVLYRTEETTSFQFVYVCTQDVNQSRFSIINMRGTDGEFLIGIDRTETILR